MGPLTERLPVWVEKINEKGSPLPQQLLLSRPCAGKKTLNRSSGSAQRLMAEEC